MIGARDSFCCFPPDQFVVPDHRAAAMENWGLVVYEEGSLLYDEKSCSPLHKEDIVDLVAHELAHQVAESQ